MSADLVRFVEARIAEDEAAGTWGQGCITVADPAPRISIDPARVLRQCEAFRRIVSMFEPKFGEDVDRDLAVGNDLPWMGREALRTLARVWSDHPDYRQEWAA